MEVLVEIFLEFLLQVIMEFCADAGLRVKPTKEEPEKPPHILWSIISYGTFGAGVGLLTLLFWPAPPITEAPQWLIRLILIPGLAGLCMTYLGNLRRKKGQMVIRFESFIPAFTFAFMLAIVRIFSVDG